MPKFKELVNMANSKTQIIMKVDNNGIKYPIIEFKNVLSMEGRETYLDEKIYDTTEGYAFWFSGYIEVFKDYNKKIKDSNRE